MNEFDIKINESDLISLLNDVHFDRIELGLRTSNIFDILKISRAEIRHSNFLGWLLDPNEGHGLKELVLKRFLRDLFSNERAKKLNALDADSLEYKKVEVRREWLNIDILILIENKVIAVENKFDSKEHSNQLERYKEIVDLNFPNLEKIFVFMTPYGENPEKDKDYYIPYSYIRFTDNLEKLVEIYGHSLNLKIQNYIYDYLSVLKRNIMQNDVLNDLAIKLYKSHKTTLDFIFENRPDIELEVRELIEEKVKASNWELGSKNKGYVRFLTKGLKEIIPVYDSSNGWPNRESFLFEIDFYWSNKKSFNFKTVISPGETQVVEILKEILSRIDGAQKPVGEKWVSHFLVKRKFNLDQIEGKTKEERQDEINSFWDSVTELVTKVEEAIIKDGRLTKTK